MVKNQNQAAEVETVDQIKLVDARAKKKAAGKSTSKPSKSGSADKPELALPAELTVKIVSGVENGFQLNGELVNEVFEFVQSKRNDLNTEASIKLAGKLIVGALEVGTLLPENRVRNLVAGMIADWRIATNNPAPVVKKAALPAVTVSDARAVKKIHDHYPEGERNAETFRRIGNLMLAIAYGKRNGEAFAIADVLAIVPASVSTVPASVSTVLASVPVC